MSAGKYPSIFSRQMEAIVYIYHAKPIKTLELHYTMIQFLIMYDIPFFTGLDLDIATLH